MSVKGFEEIQEFLKVFAVLLHENVIGICANERRLWRTFLVNIRVR